MYRLLLFAVLALALGASLALSACAGQGPAAPAPAPSSPAAPPASSPPAPAVSSPPAKAAASPSASAASPAAKPSASDDAAQRQLIEAAKKEGQVVYYVGIASKGSLDAIVPLFAQRYGIDVRYVQGSGTAGYQRVTMEATSGQRVGDLISSGTTTMGTLLREGLLDEWKPPNGQFVDQRLYQQSQAGTPIYVNLYGILLNTTMVKEGEITTWQDLLNPKWAGKIMMTNPTIAGSGNTTFVSTYKTFGREFHEKLAAQKPMVLDDERAAEAQLARGEAAILIPGQAQALVFQEGAPIKLVQAKDGVGFTPIAASVLKNAPHPNAAKLFLDFLLSEEIQSILEKVDMIAPARNGVAQRPELRLDNLSFLQGPSPEDQAQVREIWFPRGKEIYGLR